MNVEQARLETEKLWDESILDALTEYITIPNESPAFDPDWQANGHMDRAVALAERWVRSHELPGMTVEVVRLEGRTPVLLVEVPGKLDGTVLLYGHLDKQPPMEGWHEGLGAWTPVLRDGRLYGRGGADDGYAVFASLGALKALASQGVAHARCVLLIECSEESGSIDLPPYIEHLAPRIGTPDLVICLDSGCGDYDRLWLTTSLRGLIGGTLEVQVLNEGVHSGDASGVVPSSFRIARQLLSRLEDAATGEILVRELYTEIPDDRLQQADAAAAVLGTAIYDKFPFVDGMQPAATVPRELLLSRTWRPQLAVTGAGGLPPIAKSGNVLRPTTSLRLSVRLPPRVDTGVAEKRLKDVLTSDPPYGAIVRFEPESAGEGWNAPPLAGWLDDAIQQSSRDYFGRDSCAMGEGGSIPFMGMLGKRFPSAQFLITGVLGPHSNAHGPNEFLDIATGKRLTCCVAHVVAAHGRQRAAAS